VAGPHVGDRKRIGVGMATGSSIGGPKVIGTSRAVSARGGPPANDACRDLAATCLCHSGRLRHVARAAIGSDAPGGYGAAKPHASVTG
jgi:hypothetical protein